MGQRGLDAFESIYVREIICGQTDGANTYVGGASSPLIGPFLRGDVGLHALMDYVNDQELCVYVQIFRDFRTPGIPPPVYEVVVGRLRRNDLGPFLRKYSWPKEELAPPGAAL